MFIYKRGYFFLIILVALISALLGGIAGGLLVSAGAGKAPLAVELEETPEIDLSSGDGQLNTIQLGFSDVETLITEVVQKVGPAVVTVIGSVDVDTGNAGGTATAQVSGSGVFIRSDGYLVTNEHVIDGARDFYVILSDGRELEAELIGFDVFTDLAVLKTAEPSPAVAVLGNSDVLDPGEAVVAIGSPLGEFLNSVTMGVVSAINRSIDTGRGYSIESLIQTDAAINQGNSGGPLVNLAGEVIGINNLVVRGSSSGAPAEGLGFAIPSNTVLAVAGQIIETGDFARPFIGVQWRQINPNIAQRFNLPVEWGAYVTGVSSDGPANLAGIQQDDIIFKIGDVRVDEDNSFINILFQYHPGDTLEIGVVRDGDEVLIEVVAGGL
jgi:2-alkenal reductase